VKRLRVLGCVGGVDPKARWGDWLGERCGSAIVSLEDVREALRGVPMTYVTVRFRKGGLGEEREVGMWRRDVSGWGGMM